MIVFAADFRLNSWARMRRAKYRLKFQLKEMNFMNPKDNRETNDQPIAIEDLSAENAESIQGGGDDKRQNYLKIELENTLVSSWS
jgi:hypothetical protein